MPVIAFAYVFPDNPDDETVQETGRFLAAQAARQRGFDPAGLIVRRVYDERHVLAWVGGETHPTDVPMAMLAAMYIAIPPGSAHFRVVRWEARRPDDPDPPPAIDLRGMVPVDVDYPGRPRTRPVGGLERPGPP